MNNGNFNPDWVSAPGDTIAEILSERKLSVADFAKRMEQSLSQTEDLLQGKATITIGVARRLGQVLGASVKFWMSRDFQYREDVGRIRKEHAKWLSDIPIGDMIKFGWLHPTPNAQGEGDACLRFFGVRSLQAWHAKYANVELMAAFRTSQSFESRPAAVAAWLRQGEREAEHLACAPWGRERFEGSMTQIRRLTRGKDPAKFIPALRGICAESGVAVAIVRSPNGCRASGAARFVSADKALLQFSFRHLSDDQFWFTFFHEAGHVILHADKGLFVDGIGESETQEESEANAFAANILVPANLHPRLETLPIDARSIVQFAQSAGTSPGVVVGQLQHVGRIPHSKFNKLKRRFTWSD